MNKQTFYLVLHIVFMLLGYSRAAEPEENVWEPQRTWVFCVGILEWKDPKLSGFPKENRQDAEFVKVLRDRGVPENQIQVIEDRSATTERIVDQFQRFVTRPASGDTLILYYCGHGHNSSDHRQTFLASHDASDNNPGVRVGWFFATIEQLYKGSRVLIAADHCCSGGIAESVKAAKKTRVDYTVFCSAHVNSSSTGAWTFTENLVSGFRGEPYMDDNADGVITFTELAANTVEDMAFADDQMAQFVVTNKNDWKMTISKSTSKPSDKVGRRAEFLSGGEWYRGFVTATEGDRYRVHYYGFPSSEDEWVKSDQIRLLTKKTYPANSKAKVLSAGEWYDATILSVRNGLHHVKFDGWEREWNEWVPASRIQTKRRRE